MSEYQITLITRDGQELIFACDESSDVISAAEQASFVLPSLCKDGGCGACLGHCQEGEYTLGSYNPTMLSDEAMAKREVLLCRTFPHSDLRITAPYDYAQILFGKLGARQAVISVLETLAERTVLLKLNWKDSTDNSVEFEPGQCMELEIPDTGIRRAYSIANTGNWRGELEFLIRLQPEGKFSTYLSGQAAVGQVLDVYGPCGVFGLQTASYNPVIFIAGGAGLAPFLSILRRMANWGEDRQIQLLFGVNHESELFYLDELQGLQRKLPSLAVTLCVWQPSPNWNGFSGTPADALQQYLLNHPSNYDLYLCGPPLLVNAATQIAIGHGIPMERIFSEKFG